MEKIKKANKKPIKQTGIVVVKIGKKYKPKMSKVYLYALLYIKTPEQTIPHTTIKGTPFIDTQDMPKGNYAELSCDYIVKNNGKAIKITNITNVRLITEKV